MNDQTNSTPAADDSASHARPQANESQLPNWLLTGAGLMAWRSLRRVPPAAAAAGLVTAGALLAYGAYRKIRSAREADMQRAADQALSLAETRAATERLASAWGAHLSVSPATSGIAKVRPDGAPAPQSRDEAQARSTDAERS